MTSPSEEATIASSSACRLLTTVPEPLATTLSRKLAAALPPELLAVTVTVAAATSVAVGRLHHPGRGVDRRPGPGDRVAQARRR